MVDSTTTNTVTVRQFTLRMILRNVNDQVELVFSYHLHYVVLSIRAFIRPVNGFGRYTMSIQERSRTCRCINLVAFIETATRIMLDAPYSQPDKTAFDIDWIGVKASQFSFSRLHKADPVLGVDMSSTGEVGCIGDDFSEALLSAMIATGFQIPQKGVMFSSGAMKSKVDLLESSRMLFNKGYKIYATAGTAAFLNAHGVGSEAVYWPDERPDAENNVMKMIAEHKFDLIVNIPKNHTKRELTNGYRIRRGAIDHNIPLITNARLASAFIEAFCELKLEDIAIKNWQEYK